jgi:hypothetical protein
MQNRERRARGSRGGAHQRWGGRERPGFGGGRQPAHGSAYTPWWHSGASLATGRGGGCEVRRGEPQSSASLLQRLPRPANRRREPLPCSARADVMRSEKSVVVLRSVTRDGSPRWSCGLALWSSLRRRPAPVAPLGGESTVPGGGHGARLRRLGRRRRACTGQSGAGRLGHAVARALAPL